MSGRTALVDALNVAFADHPVYDHPVSSPAVPCLVVTPADPWVERVSFGACTLQWTWDVHLLARRADVDGAFDELEAGVARLAQLDLSGAGTWQSVSTPRIEEVGGIDYLAATVTYTTMS